MNLRTSASNLPDRGRRRGGAADSSGGPGAMSLISPSVIGAMNRGRILQALYDNGPTSRVELARLAGVNRTTVTGIVQPMLEEGLLAEGDALRSSGQGGKPARPLYFNPDAPMLGAVLVLPGTVTTALVTLTGAVNSVRHARFDPSGDPAAFRETLFATLADTLAQTTRPPFGIGVAAGGMIDSDKGVILAVSLAPVLSGMPLLRMLEDRFGLTTIIDHHPRALLVGDRWFGPGRNQQSFAAIYTGEVLGGAFYMNGRVYRGVAGSGGELGHTVVKLDGALCNCGKRGCWETVATLPWLRREARERDIPDPEAIGAARLVAEERAGSTTAGELLDTYARNLAVGIANLQNTLSLGFYVIHGDAAMGGDRMAELVRMHAERFALARPNEALSIIPNGAGDGLTALQGAAGLVVSHHLKLMT